MKGNNMAMGVAWWQEQVDHISSVLKHRRQDAGCTKVLAVTDKHWGNQ